MDVVGLLCSVIQVKTMTRDMIIDAIVAGAGIWGCMVARRRMVAGRKVLERRAGGGEE